MKSIFVSLAMALVIIFSASSSMAGTVHWFWAKPIYTSDGLATMSREVVKYDIDVDADDFIGECNRLNIMISTVAMVGQFSNIPEFQAQINRAIRNDKVLSNFRITDVYVDER